MNLHDLLEDGLTDAPALHLETHLRAGRRAVRRRRIASGVAGGLVVVAAASAAWATTGSPSSAPGPTGQLASPGATYPANPATVAPTAGPMTVPPGLPSEAAVFETDTGRLLLSDGWWVVETVETPLTEPAGGEPQVPTKSVGLTITDGRHEQWVLLWWDKGDGSSASWTNSRGGFPSLQSWLDYRVAAETGGSTDQLLSMRADGTLEPRHGVTLLAQRRTPELDRAGSETAVARVRVLHEQWYVLATRTDDTTSYYPVGYPSEGDPDTVDGFVDHITPQVEQGRYR
jgi:hypothetical protein